MIEQLHENCIQISGAGCFSDVESSLKANGRTCFVLSDSPDFRCEAYAAGYQPMLCESGHQIGFGDPALITLYEFKTPNVIDSVNDAFAMREADMKNAERLGCRTHVDDLQQIIINEVDLESGGTLKAKSPVRFNPYFLPKTCESSDEHYGFLYPPLTMMGLESSRKRLIDLIEAHIEFAWVSYAEEDDSKLAPSAADLGRKMRETFERA